MRAAGRGQGVIERADVKGLRYTGDIEELYIQIAGLLYL